MRAKKRSRRETDAPAGSVRYAVVGLGWYAQSAILPAFAGASRNSKLVALVSDDAAKRRRVRRARSRPTLVNVGDPTP
jgi:glucose-fructose oxidoreductase